MPVQATERHRLLDALLHRWDVPARDRPADDLVDELESLPSGQWFDVDDAHAELSMTARLLLVFALDVDGAARDRLPVGNAQLFRVDVDTELASELLERDLQMRLAASPHDRLLRFLPAFDDERRILLLQAVQGVGQLALVGLGAG